ncbi:amidase [Pseudooceanicola sp. C21-150M6]|uniref:amidase n=1 Tax=Pseudooceanicola sp. C21-150M6 TaxID=3434355 RepID=UPI003D7F535F
MDLTTLDATRLSELIAAREVSCAEVMAACFDRIEAVNAGVNAIVALRDRDAAMAEARSADTRSPQGWLHGIPVAVKDLSDAAGLPTSRGSPLFAGAGPAETDSLFVARMRAAGAIVIGKTNTPEFGLGSHTVNPVYGATQNAYAPGRSAGGSSGGTAVALATGMQWVADGSDMMGSLRNPAGWGNVYGFRPTRGRVPASSEGDLYLHLLATAGPMARSPEDLGQLLDVMSGADPRLPLSFDAPRVTGRLKADLKGRRIGWVGDWGGAWPMEDGLLAHCEAALKSFEALGCEIVPLPAPFPAEALWQAWIDLRSLAVAGSEGPLLDVPENRPLLRRDAIWEIEQGRALSAGDILRASATRSRWFRRAMELFAEVDALVMPTAQCWPFPIDWDHPKEIAGVAMDTYHRWMECVIPASILGLPAVAVPAGFGPEGMPIGLQIVGPVKGDLEVLQLAQGWHAETGWPRKRPALRDQA